MGRRSRVWLGVGLAASLSAGWIASQPVVEAQPTTAPTYDPDGNLLLPKGFETWVFVGADLGLVYKPGLPETTAVEAARATPHEIFHNIYINPEAYEHFRATKKFPDLTILVMEEFVAADKDPKQILAHGVYEDTRVGLEVAVKNSHRPDGQKTPWAYYSFMSSFDPTHHLAEAAPAFDDASCETCHKAHASMDNVWVQFYPTLRKLLE